MQKRDIVIIGSGGLAREVRWLIEECNKVCDQWNILGWISKEKPGSRIAGLPVLGDDDWLLGYERPVDVAVSVGNGLLRKKIAEYLKQNPNLSFPVILSPTAQISQSVELGEGSIVTANSILTVDIVVGDFFFCNLASTVGHDCRIGDYVTLNPGVHVSGNVTLEDKVTIGTGAVIIQGITIGEGATIGAGASVVREIEAGCTAVGIPARPLERKV